VSRLRSFAASLREFTLSFWTANVSELFERIAFYGMTSVLVLFLTKSRGFDNSTAIVIGGYFGLFTYGLAAFSGFLADLLGYRRAILLAYSLLASGYLLTGQVAGTIPILASLFLVAFGASLIKPSITGTVQKTCTDAQRPLGFSIYYTLVNIGGSSGPAIQGWVVDRFGVERFYLLSAGAVLLALILILLVFKEPVAAEGETGKKSFAAFLRDFGRVLTNLRLMLLILCVAGWWSMFYQLYGPFPLYVTDDLHGSGKALGALLAIDGVCIVLFQILAGYLVRNLSPGRAVAIATVVSSAGIAFMGIAPSIVVAGIGIVGFSIGEMIYSAHFYRYLGSIAPKDQIGMYMGFAFLPIALGYFLAGLIGGPIYAFFKETMHAPQLMWFAFAAVGLVSAAGMAILAWRPRA